MSALAWSLPVCGLLSAVTASAEKAAEKPAAAADQESELQIFQLETQLEQSVVSSTKSEQRSAEAPAVITVVTSDEIRDRGYTSLAEILRWVPGFYDVYDGVTHNVGVRGINGGIDASGDLIKVMIDGHPVDYRPTTGNFFGPELIPIELVDRVEIIRGPASAIYGANAFLGVINVITRSGSEIKGATLVGQAELIRGNPGGGGSLVLGNEEGPVDLLIGASFRYENRSGMTVPASSPNAGSLAGNGPTQGDFTRPKSFFGKASLANVAGGRITLQASIQSVDSKDELWNVAPFTHGSLVGQLNQNYWLTYEAKPGDRIGLTASAYYFSGSPTSQSKFDLGRPDYVLLPDTSAEGFGATAEVRESVLSWLQLTEGLDFVQEHYVLQTFDKLLIQDVAGPGGVVLQSTGTVIPGNNQGATADFRNLGVFAQGVARFAESWSATVGGRLDVHNIYGVYPSARLGVVYAPQNGPLSLKLLYGSSFKAPSAVQLYTQPASYFSIEGNPVLKAQTANTVELVGAWRLPGERGELSLNLFGSDVAGRVEFLQAGFYLQARNVGEDQVVGAEVDGRFILWKPIHLRAIATVAKTVGSSGIPQLSGLPQVTNPLFPPYQVHLILDALLPWWGLRLSPEVSLVGPRNCSQSNALIAGQAYSIPPYVYTAVSLSTRGRRVFGDRETSLALRVSDLLNVQWTEPGFGGVDFPTLGRTVTFTATQEI
jgi:outer membrane receptor protein involved in Fe transport